MSNPAIYQAMDWFYPYIWIFVLTGLNLILFSIVMKLYLDKTSQKIPNGKLK